MKRVVLIIVLLGAAASWLTGCGAKKAATGQAGAPTDIASAHGSTAAGANPPAGTGGPPPDAAPPSPGAMGGMPPGGVVPPPPSGSPTSAAGLTWKLPAGWILEEPRTMRVATYGIPATSGDAEGAECAVYYFGQNQGGGVDANLERWIGQFQPVTQSKRSTRQVSGIAISLADASGTYTAHGGSMNQPQGDKPGWRLLGAIAEGPQGAVFFKLAGPAKTVAAASAGFDALVGSLRKE